MKLLVLFTKDDADSAWAWDSIFHKFEDWMESSFPNGQYQDETQVTKWELVEANDDVAKLLRGNTGNSSIHGNSFDENGMLELTDEDNERIWEWLKPYMN